MSTIWRVTADRGARSTSSRPAPNGSRGSAASWSSGLRRHPSPRRPQHASPERQGLPASTAPRPSSSGHHEPAVHRLDEGHGPPDLQGRRPGLTAVWPPTGSPRDLRAAGCQPSHCGRYMTGHAAGWTSVSQLPRSVRRGNDTEAMKRKEIPQAQQLARTLPWRRKHGNDALPAWGEEAKGPAPDPRRETQGS